MPSRAPHADRQALLDRLRADLARLERGARAGDAGVLPLDLPGIDRTLPGGGLARGCLHEICGAAEHTAAAGFAAALLGRLARDGPVVWIGPRCDLFAPGLAELGLTPERLIVVRARRREERLWALEEVLRHRGVAAGLAEVDKLGPTAGRRLQLAAEATGVTALLLRPADALAEPGTAFTRWRIAPADSAGHETRRLGAPRWRVELVRARGGRPGAWQVEWHEEGWHEIADTLAPAADAADRPADPAREA